MRRPEYQIELALVNAVEALGGVAVKLAIIGARGFPDRTLLMPGGWVVFVECKAPKKGRVKPQQREWLSTLHGLGFEACVVRGAADVEALAGRLRGGPQK